MDFALLALLVVLAGRTIQRFSGDESATEYPRVVLDSPALVLDHPEAFKYKLQQAAHPEPFFLDLCHDSDDPNWSIGATLVKLVYQDRWSCKSIRSPYFGFIEWRDHNGKEILKTTSTTTSGRPTTSESAPQEAITVASR